MTAELFDAFRLGDLSLPNRIVMAPMTRSRASGEVADELTALYYRQRATAGLIVTEGTPISREAVGYAFLPGIWSQQHVEGWRGVTSAVHATGGRIFAQLWHVGRVSHTSLQEGAQPPVSSTDEGAEGERVFAFATRPDGSIGFVQPSKPRRLATDEIPRIVEDYANGARNAIAAGFDGVEIHAAHGYLIEQFLNSAINHRDDAYGGSIEARSRLLLDIVDAVIDVVGSARLGVRLSPLAQLLGAPEYPENEVTYLRLFSELGRRGIGYLHLSDTGVRNGTALVGEQLLKRARDVFPGAIILAGGLDQAKAERLIEGGLIDLAAFGQPFIANPDLVWRMRHGAPLATPDRDTYYGGAAAGYTDYPTYTPATPQPAG